MSFDGESTDSNPKSRRESRELPPPPQFWTDKIANAGPIGLLGFGTTTILLMCIDAGWTEVEGLAIVYGYALSFGGLWQGIAAIFEILKGHVFAGAAFATYSAFWLGWAFMWIRTQEVAYVDGTGTPVFTLLGPKDWRTEEFAWRFVFGVVTLFFTVVTLRTTFCLFTVFALLTATFFLLAAGSYEPKVTVVGGYFGFFAAVFAFYTAFAEILLAEWGVTAPGLQKIPCCQRKKE